MRHLTKEMIESKKDLLLLELENMKKEKCQLKKENILFNLFYLTLKK